MFASRRDAADDDVRERFIRVVGLPEDEDIGAPPPTGSVPSPVAPPPVAPVAPVAPVGLRGAAVLLDPGRRGVRALAAVAVVAVAVAAFLAWQARPHVEPVSAHTEASAAASPSSSGAPGVVVVAVTGRVRRPGLIRLPTGARVADAIEAAGGILPDTDLSFVNLARKVADGELVTIGVNPPPGVAAGAGGAEVPGGQPAGPLNLNTATAAQFEALPGIGPVLAQHIVNYRTRHGQFRSIDELRQVEGLGAARFTQIKPLVTL